MHSFRSVLREYAELHQVRVELLLNENSRAELVECPETQRESGGWKFDEFDELSEAMMYRLSKFRDQRIPDDQIMVDFTGGQKTTSVVAAAVTFNRRIKAQYVNTNRPWNVRSYDLIIGLSETGGMEA